MASAKSQDAKTVRCSHLLIKHKGSRNPKSWKDPDGKEITQRTKEQAIAILEGHIKVLKEGKVKFADLAKANSDCGSAAKGGDLGNFGHGMMQAPFEAASFALQVNEMSGIVDTESGVHIILRTG